MAGTIPLSMSQQFDEFGKPLKGGKLTIYQAGTVATPQNAYQDYGLTILQPSPMTLDAAGRIPQFFLADGFVKTELRSADGIIQSGASRDGVLVVGPSSGSGGGGSGADPTTLIQTGMMALYYGIGALTGYVRANGRTIGNSTSSATEATGDITKNLWIFLYTVDPNLAVSGGRTGNALNDYNASKQLALPDFRGYAPTGLDGMGSGLAGRLTGPYAGLGVGGFNADLLGAVAGLESNQLGAGQIPAHAHTIGMRDPGHFHNVAPTPFTAFGSFQGFISGTGSTGSTGGTNTDTKPTGVTIGSNGPNFNDGTTSIIGSGGSHNNTGPRKLISIYLKL